MSGDTTPSAPERLPPGVVLRKSGNFQAGLRADGRNIIVGTFPTIEEAVEARLRALAERGLPAGGGKPGRPKLQPPASVWSGPLPAGVSRTPSGRFIAQTSIHGARRFCGTHDSPDEAGEAIQQARAEAGVGPMQSRKVRVDPASAAADDDVDAAGGGKASWWNATRRRIDALVERVEAEEGLGQFVLPPDPRRRPV